MSDLNDLFWTFGVPRKIEYLQSLRHDHQKNLSIDAAGSCSFDGYVISPFWTAPETKGTGVSLILFSETYEWRKCFNALSSQLQSLMSECEEGHASKTAISNALIYLFEIHSDNPFRRAPCRVVPDDDHGLLVEWKKNDSGKTVIEEIIFFSEGGREETTFVDGEVTCFKTISSASDDYSSWHYKPKASDVSEGVSGVRIVAPYGMNFPSSIESVSAESNQSRLKCYPYMAASGASVNLEPVCVGGRSPSNRLLGFNRCSTV